MAVGATDRLLVLAVPVLGCWWAWAWYVDQLRHNPSALPGLAAALLALALGARALAIPRAEVAPINQLPLVATGLVTLAAGAAMMTTTPLVATALALLALALGIAAVGGRMHPGVVGLGLLALPVGDAIDFYAGYPLRAAVTSAAASLLSLSGGVVTARGVMLESGARLVAVDVPCSGLSMAWMTGVAFAGLSAWFRLSVLATLAMAGLGGVLFFAGNVVRVASLYHLAAMVDPPAMAHEAIGIVVAAGVLVCLAAGCVRLSGGPQP